MSLAKVIPLHTNQVYHSRRHELGIKRELVALSCKGITKHGRLCGNQTTNNPAYCRQHIEQAPGGTVYESMLALHHYLLSHGMELRQTKWLLTKQFLITVVAYFGSCSHQNLKRFPGGEE